MGGCSAPFCNNSSTKGYAMKVFPKCPKRRALWLQNVPRKNWTPTDNSALCEVHFAPEMWENRADNKRKLKPNAIPTIFGYYIKHKVVENVGDMPEIVIENKEDNIVQTVSTNELIVSDIPESSTSTAYISYADESEEERIYDCKRLKQEIVSDIPEPSILTAYISCADESEEERKYDYERLKEIINKQQLTLIRMRKKVKTLSNTIHILKNHIKNDKYKKALYSVFNDDQINALLNDKRRVKNWSKETIKRALQLKFVCEVNGYEELLRQGLPLPSLRTVRRKLENFQLNPGISEEMFEFLKHKKSSFEKDTNFECGLLFDEMSIRPKKCYNSSTETLVGDITFPNEKGAATHALVFMLVGICSRWKHVIGYHLTGNSFSSETLKQIIFQIIRKVEEIGFHVNFITSDMGPGNIGVWRLLGISAGRYNETRNSIRHPFDSNRSLYIIADPPHLLKNLKQALLANRVITIPEDIVLKYNLPTAKIQLAHIYEMLHLQENSELLLTPKLKLNDINSNNHFNKMKVNKATHFFSNDVSSALQLLATANKKPEYLTTAWFVQIIHKWFGLMTSRTCILALGTKNYSIYNGNINFLHEIIYIFTKLKIGNGEFKPVQKGLIISTISVINLTKYLINEKKFSFVLTSRFTQDCVENLFSQIRRKHVTPDPLQFIYNLKIISIAMYMQQINNSNYENDDYQYLTGFLEYLQMKTGGKNTLPAIALNLSQIPEFNNLLNIKLTLLDVNSLYNIAGYIIHSITKTCKVCSNCLRCVGSKTALDFSFSKFVQLKSYTKNSLFYVNRQTFKIFIKLEKIFRHYSKYFNNVNNINLRVFLTQKCKDIKANHILQCHNLFTKIIKRFIVFRLRTFNNKKKNVINKFSSKSMAAHSTF